MDIAPDSDLGQVCTIKESLIDDRSIGMLFRGVRAASSLTFPLITLAPSRARASGKAVGGESLPVTEVSPEGWERVVGFSRHLTLSRQILQWEFRFDTVQLNSEIDPRTFRIF